MVMMLDVRVALVVVVLTVWWTGQVTCRQECQRLVVSGVDVLSQLSIEGVYVPDGPVPCNGEQVYKQEGGSRYISITTGEKNLVGVKNTRCSEKQYLYGTLPSNKQYHLLRDYRLFNPQLNRFTSTKATITCEVAPPQDFAVYAKPDPTSLKLTWRPGTNAKPQVFKLEYRKAIQLLSNFRRDNSKITQSGGMMYQTVTGLNPDTSYTIRVAAYIAQTGYGDNGYSTFQTLLKEETCDRQIDIDEASLTNTSLSVEWTFAKCSPDQKVGVTVRYRLLGDETFRIYPSSPRTIPIQDKAAQIPGSSSQTYEVQLRAFGSTFGSVVSETVQVSSAPVEKSVVPVIIGTVVSLLVFFVW